MSNEVDPLVNINNLLGFGTPHHGLIKGGVLTKTNGTTMDYPQPMSGAVGKIKFPLTPAVTNPVTSNGFEWRDYAVIGGEKLYGKDIGYSLLYRDATTSGKGFTYVDGVNQWLCNAAVISITAGVVLLRVSYSGVFVPQNPGAFDVYIRTALTLTTVDVNIFNFSFDNAHITVMISDADNVKESTQISWVRLTFISNDDGISGANYYLDPGAVWLYQSPDKKTWQVDATGLDFDNNLLADGIVGDLILTRFGHLTDTVELEQHSIPITLSDVEQAAPVITSPDNGQTLDVGDLVYMSNSEDGSKGALTILGSYASLSSGYVVGFIEITLSDVEPLFGASATVLRNRAVTLGTLTDSPSTWTGTGGTWGSCWFDGPPHWLDDDIACPGFSDIGFEHIDGTTDSSRTLSDRILGIVYDESAVAVDQLLTLYTTFSASYSSSKSGATASRHDTQNQVDIVTLSVGSESIEVVNITNVAADWQITLEEEAPAYTETYSATVSTDYDGTETTNVPASYTFPAYIDDTSGPGVGTHTIYSNFTTFLNGVLIGRYEFVTTSPEVAQGESNGILPAYLAHPYIMTLTGNKVNNGAATKYMRDAISRDGTVAHYNSDTDAAMLHATSDPETGILEHPDGDPICYI